MRQTGSTTIDGKFMRGHSIREFQELKTKSDGTNGENLRYRCQMCACQVEPPGQRLLVQSVCGLYPCLQVLLCLVYETVYQPSRTIIDGISVFFGQRKGCY